ncbi:hypothetical protein JCM11641_008380 [Rhodosporidiobolus odoratus]
MITTRSSAARVEAARVKVQALENGVQSLVSLRHTAVASVSPPPLSPSDHLALYSNAKLTYACTLRKAPTQQASVVLTASLTDSREITPTNLSPSNLDKVALLAPTPAPRMFVRSSKASNALELVPTQATVKSAKKARTTATGKAKIAGKGRGQKATSSVEVTKDTNPVEIRLSASAHVTANRFDLLSAAASQVEAERVEVEMAAFLLVTQFSSTSRKRSAEHAEIEEASRALKNARESASVETTPQVADVPARRYSARLRRPTTKAD